MVSSVVRHLGAGALAVAGVIASGAWLGHRLDPTWARRNAPLRRRLPFALPALPELASPPALRGHPWILDLRFSGCGASDSDVAARADRVAAGIARRVVTLEPPALAAAAVGLGLADSAQAAANGLLDARHWLFAVDGAGWVRGAADITDDAGWAALAEAVHAAATAPPGLPEARAVAALPSERAAPARLPAFRAVDQQMQSVTTADFAGHPLVLDFIFTRCTAACPMLTARLAALRRMVADPNVRFVSISVDPAHDTPEVLRAYAARWGPVDTRWRLLAADAATVRRVARGLGELAVLGDVGPDAGPILHSDRFTLLDRDGAVAGRFASADPAVLRALAARLDEVAARGSAPGQTGAGAELFASLGCRGCHDRTTEGTTLAPSLAGLAGRPVRLTDGRIVAADDGYLRESITAPLAAVVDGFAPTMPGYAGLVSDADVAALVAYVHSL